VNGMKAGKMSRPELRSIPLVGCFRRGNVTITMSVGQWDGLLQAAYEHGCILFELDENEYPVAAYCNHDPQGEIIA
jgi:hypothetical protein